MYVGIDIGGTNLKAGLVSESGALLRMHQEPLGAVSGPEALTQRLVQIVRDTAEEALEQVVSVGIGVPGAVRDGSVLYTCNIPMENFPLEQRSRRQLDLPVYLANDADCAAWGEYCCGAGRGCQSVVVITLGTGVGAGMVFHGKRYEGLGMAGEVGHMVVEPDGVPCPCGRRGCWEQYASASGLRRIASEAMEAHRESLLWKMTGGRREALKGSMPFEAARQGDPTAQTVCAVYIRYLAQGITNLVNLLHPEVIAIGGGISNEREESLLQPLREIVDRECYARHGGRKTKLVKAELGNRAGIIGAALIGTER